MRSFKKALRPFLDNCLRIIKKEAGMKIAIVVVLALVACILLCKKFCKGGSCKTGK